MRLALCTLGLSFALALASTASAQIPTLNSTPKTNGVSLPTFAGARLNMTAAFGSAFGLRHLLPTFRDSGPVTGNMTGVPDTSNAANYLKGFGYKRLP